MCPTILIEGGRQEEEARLQAEQERLRQEEEARLQAEQERLRQEELERQRQEEEARLEAEQVSIVLLSRKRVLNRFLSKFVFIFDEGREGSRGKGEEGSRGTSSGSKTAAGEIRGGNAHD